MIKISSNLLICLRSITMFVILLILLSAQPVTAAPQGTVVGGTLPGDTTWTLSGSPYQVESYLLVPAGVTLTIEAGVTVENYIGDLGSQTYTFEVAGALIANGTEAAPIQFTPGPLGWSGIKIFGAPDAINTGSSLNYVFLNGGGYQGSGVSANLDLYYATAEIHHCQFNNSPGDGLMVSGANEPDTTVISDSSFSGNQGYAVYLKDGSADPVFYNLTASGNGATIPYNGDVVMLNDDTLHGNHTWEYMGLPYLILSTIVAPDSVLTIEPGVQVLAHPGNDGLDIQGRLIANGTASQVISFDPVDPSLGWSGIFIMGTEEQPSSENILHSVTVSKGGFSGYCDLYLANGDATVTFSVFETSKGSGVCIDRGATLLMFSTQLNNNQEYALDVFDAGAFFNLGTLSAAGNMTDTIGIEGGTLEGYHRWWKSGIDTYDLHYSYVTIAPTGTLTIDPGVTVRFGVTRDMTIKGSLTAIGSPDEPIVFTGETQTPGLWAGLNFIGTAGQHATGQFAYTTIEYGGYGGSSLVSIYNADVSFDHCYLRNCASDAIRILPGDMLAGKAMPFQAPDPLHITWSQLTDIGGYALNNTSSQPVQAAFNWWGDMSGPTSMDNPGGTGSTVEGQVMFWPYLTGLDTQFIFAPLVRK